MSGKKKTGDDSSGGPPDTTSLYGELQKLQQSGSDWDKALKTVHKILNLTPKDVTAIHCKVVTLLQLGRFDTCLTFLVENASLVELAFEEAYCLYR